MVITIVSDVLGEENNGTTVTTKRLIELLKLKGHTVKVISPSSINDSGYFALKKRNFGIFNDYVAKNGVILAKVDKEVIKKGIIGSDVVHIMLPFQVGKAAAKIAHELNIPTTTACHCQAENVTSHLKIQRFKMPNRAVYKYFYKNFYHQEKFIHCPTNFIANELKRNHYNQDMRIISNGVSKEYCKYNVKKPDHLKDKFCILSIGRLAREKRQDLLIKAVKKSKYENSIQIILAGVGPLEKKYKKMAKHLTNKPVINFYKSKELIDIINYSDLYVHPADIELEGIALLEAITCGLVPIVSSSHKSATKYLALHPQNIFSSNNVKDLTKKIDFFIENSEEKSKMSKEYMTLSKKFAIDECIEKMIEMFNDAIYQWKGGRK